jgi:hypothetical protein
MKPLYVIFFLIPLILTSNVCLAADTTSNDSDKSERKSGQAKLVKKFQNEKGEMVPIGVLAPLDYTTLNFGPLASETIIGAMGKYGKFNIKTIEYSPASLTLEEFRKVVTKYNLDVTILCVLKPTNFDLFLYDRRNPYRIFLHSEVLPEAVQYQLTKQVVEEYTKVIVRRVLYAYMQDQFFELPREETRPLLTAEIPRWIASNQSFQTVNREIMSRLYLSGSVGAAFSSAGGGAWTSNLINVQVGYRFAEQLIAEFGIDFFAYTAPMLSGKYLITSKDSPFRLTAGLGFAKLSNTHTLNWDQTYGFGEGGMFVVPSFSISFPIVEAHFKIESHLFVGSGVAFCLMPGILYLF